MVSTVKSRTPAILATTEGIPKRVFISSAKREMVAATVTTPIAMVYRSKKTVTTPRSMGLASGLWTLYRAR